MLTLQFVTLLSFLLINLSIGKEYKPEDLARIIQPEMDKFANDFNMSFQVAVQREGFQMLTSHGI